MSGRHARWLLDELEELVADEVLSAAAAERLRRRYAPAAGAGKKLREIFFALLGALLVGGGVILLLAHNWPELSRPTRAVLSFLPLVAMQALALWVLRRRFGSPAWREGVALGLSLATAAAIALIAQTYHIPGDLRSFLLTWMLLTLPLVYLFDATALAVLYLAGIAGWSLTGQAPERPPVGYLGLLAALLPWLWPRLRAADARATVLGWALALSLPFAVGAIAAELARGAAIPALCVLFGWLALEAAAGGAFFSSTIGRWHRAPLLAVGAVGGVGLAFILSFEHAWPGWTDAKPAPASAATVAAWLALGLLLLRALWLWGKTLADRRWVASLFGALVLLGPALWAARLALDLSRTACALAVDLYLGALGLGLMADGWRRERLAALNAGLAILALLVVLRFFDSDLPLLYRGVAFVVVGLGFLAANRVLTRRVGDGPLSEEASP